jgi:hypothetical protein
VRATPNSRSKSGEASRPWVSEVSVSELLNEAPG